jgi:hypothetical protein
LQINDLTAKECYGDGDFVSELRNSHLPVFLAFPSSEGASEGKERERNSSFFILKGTSIIPVRFPLEQIESTAVFFPTNVNVFLSCPPVLLGGGGKEGMGLEIFIRLGVP